MPYSNTPTFNTYPKPVPSLGPSAPGTATVGYNVSSPTVPVGTVINSHPTPAQWDASKVKTSSSRSGSNSGGGSSSADIVKAAIEAERGAAQNSIDKLRGSVNAQTPGLIDSANQQFDSQIPLINQARDEGVGFLNQATGQAQQAGENALTSARGLYNELNTRNQQLFGGAQNSSVGGAASELLGREQMKQMGGIRQGVNDQVSNFALNIQNLRDKASAQLQQVELQRQAAISDVKNRVADALRQIDQLEFQTGQDYSQDKLNAIKDYANSLRANNQYASNLSSQINQTLQGYHSTLNDVYNSYNAESQGAVTNAQSGLQSFGTDLDNGANQFAQNNSISSGSQQAYNPYQNYSGSINQGVKRPDDQFQQLQQAGFLQG